LPFGSQSGFLSCTTNNARVSGRQPDWTQNPYAIFIKQENVAAVGSGNSREIAEKNAFRNLIAIFGQTIQVDEKVFLSYEHAINCDRYDLI
jgi:hypothetical protein